MNTRKRSPALQRQTPLPATRPKTLPGKYNVERILAVRQPDSLSAPQYLILWEGYGLTDCTWEPSHHIPSELIRYTDNNYVLTGHLSTNPDHQTQFFTTNLSDLIK